ncbi:MAG: hypothetical protein OXU20_28465 [Myxococcales bacterium]|nr:hypothetical protein [Myxococcales bacterium]MDD9968533.1 hypothetical protein [Myxococcales bacterium]
MTVGMLRDRLNGLLGAQLSESEVAKLIEDVVSAGGGVNIETDDGRYRLVRREGKYELRKADRRPSSHPPFR